MKVLITGATGFVGSRLCERLVSAGHEPMALSRNADGARGEVAELTVAWSWEPTEEPAPAEAIESADAVVHLAGESIAGRWTAAKKRRIRESRVAGTRHLVDTILRADAPPEVLISASAIGYYGDRGDEVLTEDSTPGTEAFVSEVCREWEREATRAEQADVRVVRTRSGLVMDAGGGPLQAMLLPAKLGANGPLGSGRQWWSWVHRDDLVRAILFLLENEEASGAYNVTAPEPVRQREFARALGRVIHRPAFVPAPAFALKLVLGEFSSELLSSSRVVPERLQAEGFEFEHPEVEGALREALG